jgi:hypothetical protein
VRVDRRALVVGPGRIDSIVSHDGEKDVEELTTVRVDNDITSGRRDQPLVADWGAGQQIATAFTRPFEMP